MENIKPSKIERAKLYGSLYFIGLALINIAFEISLNNFSLSDLIILLVVSSPLLVNKKVLDLLFGLITGMLSLLMFVTILMLQIDNPSGSLLAFSFGLLLSAASFTAAASLIYAGLYCTEETRFSII